MIDFPHNAPEGYSYEFENVKRDTIRIMLRFHKKFDYNLGKPVATVWGFYNSKKNKYFAPVNSTTIGKEVDIKSTRPWSAMKINLTPLELAFYD